MEVYRRLRNSCRFLLGNLSGFEENQRLPYDQLSYIDKDILNKYYHLYTTILRSYDQYEFYNVYINLVIHYLLVILHSPVLWFETCPQATLILSKTDSMYVFVLRLISRRSHQQVHSCFLQKLYLILASFYPLVLILHLGSIPIAICTNHAFPFSRDLRICLSGLQAFYLYEHLSLLAKWMEQQTNWWYFKYVFDIVSEISRCCE